MCQNGPSSSELSLAKNLTKLVCSISLIKSLLLPLRKVNCECNKRLIVETWDLAEVHINEVLFWKLSCRSKNKCKGFQCVLVDYLI